MKKRPVERPGVFVGDWRRCAVSDRGVRWFQEAHDTRDWKFPMAWRLAPTPQTLPMATGPVAEPANRPGKPSADSARPA